MNPEDIPIREIHLPDIGGWWPLAPGWWVLLALLAAGLIMLLVRAYRYWNSQAARRAALRMLKTIRSEFEAGRDAVALSKELSELLRRAMLAYAPRAEVASLTGIAWLAWLDTGLQEPLFKNGAGQLIESLPYRDPATVDNDTDVRGLIDAVQARLKTPLSKGTA